jgi:hypothetical protein
MDNAQQLEAIPVWDDSVNKYKLVWNITDIADLNN